MILLLLCTGLGPTTELVDLTPRFSTQNALRETRFGEGSKKHFPNKIKGPAKRGLFVVHDFQTQSETV